MTTRLSDEALVERLPKNEFVELYENRVGITFEVAPQQTIITTLPKPPLPILQIIVNVFTVAVFLIVVGHLLVT